jgi:hypothetical protein
MPKGLMYHIDATYIKFYHRPAESKPAEGKIKHRHPRSLSSL